jgi:Protein of unknown function (DUF2569)
MDEARGVRGWLLVLCLMLTVVGPLLSVWLMAEDYASLAPQVAGNPAWQLALQLALMFSAAAMVYGIHAGLQLWRIRPQAVAVARRALLAGLAADLFTATLAMTAGAAPAADGTLVYQVTLRLVPSLVFFTVCLAYLNRSRRVDATYAIGTSLR